MRRHNNEMPPYEEHTFAIFQYIVML